MEIYGSGEWALENASELPIPLLLMPEGDDKLNSVETKAVSLPIR